MSDGSIDAFARELRLYLNEERKRVESARDALRAVLRGTGSDASAEDASTDLTNTYLTGYLSGLVPIEDDGGSG